MLINQGWEERGTYLVGQEGDKDQLIKFRLSGAWTIWVRQGWNKLFFVLKSSQRKKVHQKPMFLDGEGDNLLTSFLEPGEHSLPWLLKCCTIGEERVFYWKLMMVEQLQCIMGRPGLYTQHIRVTLCGRYWLWIIFLKNLELRKGVSKLMSKEEGLKMPSN